jgi:hypothetical protein
MVIAPPDIWEQHGACQGNTRIEIHGLHSREAAP